MPPRTVSFRFIAAIFFLAATCSIFFRCYTTWQKVSDFSRKDDFNHYYATAWLLAQGTVPYGVEFRSTPLANAFEWHELVPSATNPPLLAMTTVPLSWFAPGVAWLLWEFVVVAAVIFAYAAALKAIRGELYSGERLLTLLAVAGGSSLFDIITHGQVQGIILAFVIWGWIEFRQRRFALAAIPWAIATAMKFYTWPLLVLLSLIRPREGLASLLLLALLLALPEIAWPGMYKGFIHFGLPLVQHSASQLWHNVSLGNAIAIIAHTGPESRWYEAILYGIPLVLVSGVIAFCLKCLGKSSTTLFSRRADLCVALLAALSFVCAPVAWNSYLIVFPFSALLLWQQGRKGTVELSLTLAIWIVTQALPHPSSRLNVFGKWYTELFYPLHPWLTLGAWVALAILAARSVAKTSAVEPINPSQC